MSKNKKNSLQQNEKENLHKEAQLEQDTQEETVCDCAENEECTCHDCSCGEDCTCDDDCECQDCNCGEDISALLEKEQQTSAFLTQQLQHLQADFDNYRKRNANLAQENRQKGIFEAVKSMLPAFDAVLVAEKQIVDENVKKGLEMVEKQLLDCLSSLEITKIETVGTQFDPNLHNAVTVEECEDVPSGQILEEFGAGFTSPNGVVRFATVKIAK